MKKLFHYILLLLNLLCALALLCATLTRWIPPSQSVVPSLFSYAIPYLFLVNAVWIVFWLCLVRWTFLVSLVVCVARIGFVPCYFQLNGTADVAQDPEHNLKVMTFNAHNFSGSDGSLPIDTGAIWFVDLLRQENPDVLSIEEFALPPHYKLIDTLESMGYSYRRGIHDRMAGVTLFSKYPIRSETTMQGYGMMCTDVLWPRQTVRIVSVHLDSYRLTHDETQNLSQLNYSDTNVRRIFHKTKSTVEHHETEWKEELMPIVTSSPFPLVVCGDYNDTPGSYIYQQFSRKMHDAFVGQGRGYCATFKGGMASFRIDHVFYSDPLEALAYKRLHSDISDHYPVVFVLGVADTIQSATQPSTESIQ